MLTKKVIKIILLLVIGIVIVSGVLYFGHYAQKECNKNQEVKGTLRF